ncbi:MAG: proton-conducting transporter membrane subunit [Candidatus Omnitrophica bacterium]|nr:proton-conducting transporter membrane subunit [Candidatus Omnitrophota bacterium]
MTAMYPLFKIDLLGGGIAAAVGVFFILTCVYSFSFMKARSGLIGYYGYIFLSAVAAAGVALANNLVLLIVLWGFLGMGLYALVNMGDEASSAAAKKMLVIVGGTDALMVFGVGLLYYLTGTFQMDKIQLSIASSRLSVIAYICLAVAAFAKR